MKKILVLLSAVLMLIAASAAVSAYSTGTLFQIPWTGAEGSGGVTLHIQNVDPTDTIKPIVVTFERGDGCPPNGGDYSLDLPGLIASGSDYEVQIDHRKSVMVFSMDKEEADALVYAHDTSSADWYKNHQFMKAFTSGASFYNEVALTPPDERGEMAIHVVSHDKLFAYEALAYEDEDKDLYIPYVEKGDMVVFQNSYDNCVSVEGVLQPLGTCGTNSGPNFNLQEIAPGEYATYEVMQTGSIYADSSGNIGAVVLVNGSPDGMGTEAAYTSVTRGDDVIVAPAYNRNYDTMIAVNNIDSVDTIVKCYFYDLSGDIIKTQVKQICSMSAKTFELPAMEHESLQGNEFYGFAKCVSNGATITGVVKQMHVEETTECFFEIKGLDFTIGDLDNGPEDSAAYNMYAMNEITNAGVSPYAATALTNFFAVNPNNWVPNFETFISQKYTQNGPFGNYVCDTIREGQIDSILPSQWETFGPGWVGSMKFVVSDYTFAPTIAGITESTCGNTALGWIPIEANNPNYDCIPLETSGFGGAGFEPGIYHYYGDSAAAGDTANSVDYVANPESNPDYIIQVE